MILGCLSLPFRLLGFAVLAAILYVGWLNRDEVRRMINRATADSPIPPRSAEASASPTELVESAKARLDTLSRRRADSVVLSAAEVGALIATELEARAPGVTDSVRVELDEGEVAVKARIDAGRLPAATLGPVAEFIKGRQTIEIRGPLNLLRVGTGEWRVERVLVRGLPMPKSLWERLLSTAVPGASGDGSVTFPVDKWITGVRVTRRGATLYGERSR